MNPIDIVNLYSGSSGENDSERIVKHAASSSFSLRKVILLHRRIKQGIILIAELHHYSKSNSVGGGLLITGPSGVGKTTLIIQYLENFPRELTRQKTIIPVLYIVTPASPTVKSFAEAILLALGDPMAHRGTAEEKTFRIYQLLKACEVEMLLIDEFQHFYYTRTMIEFRQVTDWLKNMISITGLAYVLVGLDEANKVIFTNEQLARRFSSRLHISKFSLNDEKDFVEFRAVLKGLQQVLPLQVQEPLFEANLARRFLIASDGVLDYVRKILEGAVVAANRAGLNKLDMGAYEAGFRSNVWPEVADRLNPFHPESPLRRLNKAGEPFYPGDKRHAIGSPLARRQVGSLSKEEL